MVVKRVDKETLAVGLEDIRGGEIFLALDRDSVLDTIVGFYYYQ